MTLATVPFVRLGPCDASWAGLGWAGLASSMHVLAVWADACLSCKLGWPGLASLSSECASMWPAQTPTPAPGTPNRPHTSWQCRESCLRVPADDQSLLQGPSMACSTPEACSWDPN